MKITSSGLKIPFTGIKKQYSAIRNQILDATDEVLRSGQLMNGNYTAEFENWLAVRNHVKYAVTCHSGTQALEILAQYAVSKETMPCPPCVVMPSLTYAATANAFVRAGYQVVFADSDFRGQTDYKKIPHDVSYQVIVAVGMYGAALSDSVATIGQRTVLIEDAAQHWLSANCARHGLAAAISFDPMKNLANYGNGGAIVTDNLSLFDFARTWRDNGKPQHNMGGTNSRMSELDCAQMMVKTAHLDTWQLRRSVIVRYWMDRLMGSGIRSLIDHSNVNDHAYHKFVIEVDYRDQLSFDLQTKGIETRVHYKNPLHELPLYSANIGPDILSVASSLSRRVLSLPCYPELTDLEVEYIIDSVLQYSNKK